MPLPPPMRVPVTMSVDGWHWIWRSPGESPLETILQSQPVHDVSVTNAWSLSRNRKKMKWVKLFDTPGAYL